MKLPIVRLLILLAFENNWFIEHLDVSSAFLYAEVQNEIIIAIPKGYDADSTKYALKLDKALYSLKISSNNWYRKIKEILKSERYSPTICEKSVYINHEAPTCVILIFVDDILITGHDPVECKRMIKYLESKVKIRNLCLPQKFLGIHIAWEKDVVKFSQDKYIQTSVEKF